MLSFLKYLKVCFELTPENFCCSLFPVISSCASFHSAKRPKILLLTPQGCYKVLQNDVIYIVRCTTTYDNVITKVNLCFIMEVKFTWIIL